MPSLLLKKKILSILAKESLKIEIELFPQCTWKLELFSNILSVLVVFMVFCFGNRHFTRMNFCGLTKLERFVGKKLLQFAIDLTFCGNKLFQKPQKPQKFLPQTLSSLKVVYELILFFGSPRVTKHSTNFC